MDRVVEISFALHRWSSILGSPLTKGSLSSHHCEEGLKKLGMFSLTTGKVRGRHYSHLKGGSFRRDPAALDRRKNGIVDTGRGGEGQKSAKG